IEGVSTKGRPSWGAIAGRTRPSDRAGGSGREPAHTRRNAATALLASLDPRCRGDPGRGRGAGSCRAPAVRTGYRRRPGRHLDRTGADPGTGAQPHRRRALPHPGGRGRPPAGPVRAERAARGRHAGRGADAAGRPDRGHHPVRAGPDPDGPAPARRGRQAPDHPGAPAAGLPAAADRVPDRRAGHRPPVRGAGGRRRRLPGQAGAAAPPDRRALQPHPAQPRPARAGQCRRADGGGADPAQPPGNRPGHPQLAAAAGRRDAPGRHRRRPVLRRDLRRLSLRERFGYAAFERLMAEAGRRLAVIAAPAPLARLNDNSFLALVRDTTPEQLQGIAAEVRARLATETFQVREGEPLQLRSAVGHAALPGGFDSATAALEATERAALQARLLPEGVAGYVPPSAQEEQEQMALLEGEIELAYQPVVAVAGSDQARYQVLMRLRQADGTVLSAG